MTLRRFLYLLGALAVLALIIYLLTTPRGSEIPLIGVVDGNEVIVGSKITGRIVRLTVDEGAVVQPGQLIAELDQPELAAQLDSSNANIRALEAQVAQMKNTWTWTNAATEAQLNGAAATLTATKAQLDEAGANLWRDEVNYKRVQSLYDSGVFSAQDRDTSEAALRASRAHAKSLEDQVKAQQADLAVAQANRKQLEVQQSQLAAAQAQLQQARAAKDEAAARLGYTEIYAPIGGIVSVRVAKQGEVVQPGAPIVVIVDVDHLWVRAEVEESYIDAIRFGEPLEIRLPSGDTLQGTVFFKGVEGDFATQRDVSRTKRDIKTFAIKVALPNPQHRLFTGMTATVLLPPPATKQGWLGRLLQRS
jgi:HlyD family secretion protein